MFLKVETKKIATINSLKKFPCSLYLLQKKKGKKKKKKEKKKKKKEKKILQKKKKLLRNLVIQDVTYWIFTLGKWPYRGTDERTDTASSRDA